MKYTKKYIHFKFKNNFHQSIESTCKQKYDFT